MNFNLMFQPFKKYADFEGRARRQEFWLFALFLAVVLVGLVTLNQLLFGDMENSPMSFVLGLGLLGAFIPALAVRVRRLHDIDRTGWWVLIGVIPFLGDLVLLVFNILPGTAGPNRFGADPKAPTDQLVEVF